MPLNSFLPFRYWQSLSWNLEVGNLGLFVALYKPDAISMFFQSKERDSDKEKGRGAKKRGQGREEL